MLVYLSMIDAPEEKSKFEGIYLKYRNLMYYVAYQILQNHHDAEDAVHQAFISVIQNMKKISEIESPKTRSYVVIIVERKAIDMQRKKRREDLLELNESISGVEIPLPGDGGLADAMSRLPCHYREVLLLRYDNDLKNKEIAQILQITESGVRKLLGRAKCALKAEL
ncbi:MAG: RNA polymerase sigma factor [Faecousia sp.]